MALKGIYNKLYLLLFTNRFCVENFTTFWLIQTPPVFLKISFNRSKRGVVLTQNRFEKSNKYNWLIQPLQPEQWKSTNQSDSH